MVGGKVVEIVFVDVFCCSIRGFILCVVGKRVLV